ncbi:MAG: hypothetical protein OXD47_07195 [Gammaproteobacteria bacterium]|nr:hypothetical protein [Gammaproteobacteria bacterium]MCY4338573.1 hypothetical protein [Gammaproteobacteria bacterium]
MPDEIIQELWQIKDSMALECGYDIDTLVANLQTRQCTTGQNFFGRCATKEANEQGAPTTPDL